MNTVENERLIVGGCVVDPVSGTEGYRDVLIRGGRIAAVEANIATPAAQPAALSAMRASSRPRPTGSLPVRRSSHAPSSAATRPVSVVPS